MRIIIAIELNSCNRRNFALVRNLWKRHERVNIFGRKLTLTLWYDPDAGAAHCGCGGRQPLKTLATPPGLP